LSIGTEHLETLLSVDLMAWQREMISVHNHLDEYGARTPERLSVEVREQLQRLRSEESRSESRGA